MIMLEFIAVARIKRADLGSRTQPLNTYKHLWLIISGEDVYTGSWRGEDLDVCVEEGMSRHF